MSVIAPIRIYDRHKSAVLCLDRTWYLKEQARGKSVLHVGCADYPITKDRLASGDLLHLGLLDVAASVTGIDRSTEGIDILRGSGVGDVHVMDAENITLAGTYDLILGGDVLEHMSNPGRFLEGVARLLKPDGEVILGVPNALSFNTLKLLLWGYEPTHKDHTFYFSPKTLAELCSRFDLVPCKLVFTAQPKDKYESDFYIFVRNVVIRAFKKTAPSFIMHFRRRGQESSDDYYIWK